MIAKVNWTAKDYFNVQDLNRIEGNIKHLNSELLDMGLMQEHLESRTDWTMNDLLFHDQLVRISHNVKKLDIGLGQTLEKVVYSFNEAVNYEHINALERNIKQVYHFVHGNLVGQKITGQFTLGMEEYSSGIY